MAVTALDMPDTLESRVARLESDVSFIRSAIADIKIDLRQMRNEISSLDLRTQEEFKAVRKQT